jgi:hypothetical protein
VTLDPALVAKVDAANSTMASTRRAAETVRAGWSWAKRFSGRRCRTTVSDLFVIGDVRDAVREGSRSPGEKADELVLGLACVGLVVTAGTYASLGAGTPARVGSLVAEGRRQGRRITGQMAEWFTRSAARCHRLVGSWQYHEGGVVDEPAVAVRAAREAVKVEKADR